MNNSVLETTGNKVSTTTNDKVSVVRPIVRKIAKFVSFGALTVVAILLIAHFAWKYSGSNQWELEIDKDGVKVYSLKAPGSSLKQFKMVTRIKTTLNRAVASLTDNDLENCTDWIKRCVSVQSVVPWNPQSQTLVTLFRVNYPSPFSPREILSKGQFTQDPKSKEVFVEFTAAPDMLPKNDCCFRIVHMHNRWRLTPLENGEIEVENSHNNDNGIPYILYNSRVPNALYFVGINLPRFFNKEKYHSASFDFIKS